MRKKIGLLFILIILLSAIFLNWRLGQYVSESRVKKAEKVVIIDAGHGAEDPGKVGVNGALEKDLNLQIAKKVKKGLEDEGIRVVMTREDDKGLYDEKAANKKLADMKKRVSLINEVKPEFAVSIHQNSYTDSNVKGAQVFYFEDSRIGEEAALLMQEELRTFDADNTRQAKANNTYYMLKKTTVPTIIVECGFLSNQEEAEKLTTEEYQEKVAQAICSGIIKWLAK